MSKEQVQVNASLDPALRSLLDPCRLGSAGVDLTAGSVLLGTAAKKCPGHVFSGAGNLLHATEFNGAAGKQVVSLPSQLCGLEFDNANPCSYLLHNSSRLQPLGLAAAGLHWDAGRVCRALFPPAPSFLKLLQVFPAAPLALLVCLPSVILLVLHTSRSLHDRQICPIYSCV